MANGGFRSLLDLGFVERSSNGDVVLWCSGFCALVKRPSGWFCTNDTRWDLVGIEQSDQLIQPTLGPFLTIEQALDEYQSAHAVRFDVSEAGVTGKIAAPAAWDRFDGTR